MSWNADVLRRKEAERAQEVHYMKLALVKPTLQTQKRKKKLPKEFDPESLATAARAHRATPTWGLGVSGPAANSPLQSALQDHTNRRHGPAPEPRAAAHGSRAGAAAGGRKPAAAGHSRRNPGAQDRQRRRQEEALEKHVRAHRKDEAEAEANGVDGRGLTKEQRRAEIAERRRRRQVFEERNAAAMAKHAERQRAVQQSKTEVVRAYRRASVTPSPAKAVVQTDAVRQVSTAPEAQRAADAHGRRPGSRGPRVANLGTKKSKQWVTVAEASPEPREEGGVSQQRRVPAAADKQVGVTTDDAEGQLTDRQLLRSKLEAAELTITHLRDELHDIKTRDVFKPVMVNDDEVEAGQEAVRLKEELSATKAEMARMRESRERLRGELARAQRVMALREAARDGDGDDIDDGGDLAATTAAHLNGHFGGRERMPQRITNGGGGGGDDADDHASDDGVTVGSARRQMLAYSSVGTLDLKPFVVQKARSDDVDHHDSSGGTGAGVTSAVPADAAAERRLSSTSPAEVSAPPAPALPTNSSDAQADASLSPPSAIHRQQPAPAAMTVPEVECNDIDQAAQRKETADEVPLPAALEQEEAGDCVEYCEDAFDDEDNGDDDDGDDAEDTWSGELLPP